MAEYDAEEFRRLQLLKRSGTRRIALRDMMGDSVLHDQVKNYFNNGSQTGDKRMEIGKAAEIVLAWDRVNGNRLAKFPGPLVDVANDVLAVMREIYMLDPKTGHVVGHSKRAQLLLAKADASARPSEIAKPQEGAQV